jgi:DNA polymerase-3 subunit delta
MSSREAFPGLAKERGGAFYLHGDDDFRKEEAVRALVDAHLDPATKDFNLDPLRGTEVDAETLASVLATPPMMAEWRVVVLREVEGLASSKKAREELLFVTADPPPGLALIMSCTVPSGSKAKFYRELAKTARSVEFSPIREGDVPGWLMARAGESHGLELDPEAAQAMATAIGNSLGVLVQELDKLAGFVSGRGRVGLADVEAAGTKLPSQDRWRWFDLVGQRRFAEAERSLGVLLGQGETGVGLVIGLATHLLRVGVAVEQGARGLERIVPAYQRWLVQRIASQAKGWTLEEIDYALAGLLDVDRLLKASAHTDAHFLKTWLLGLRVRAEAA